MENLKASCRHGCRFHSRQIRATEAKEIPNCLASSRADQWVMPNDGGGACKVATTTAASSMTGGRPERSKSCNAPIPPAV